MNISDQLMKIHAYICKVSAERDQFNQCKVKWFLDYPNPCECTKLVIGGFTTWSPNRHFTPVYSEHPLLSDDISVFRMHYGIECRVKSKCYSWAL